MKDYVLELVSKKSGLNTKLNTMREYLQAYVLRILHDEGVFRSTSFVGGTALRFLYDLPRFSEDLDFSSTKNNKDYSFLDLIKKIKEEFTHAGYEVAVSYNDKKTVQHAFIKFKGLMHEAAISPFKDQHFSIKLEIDTNPPVGAVLKPYIVNKYFPLSFLSYDNASLFSGKVHAVLCRKYTKGRDFFDLGWYLSKWKDLVPNFGLLNNALVQTDWKGEIPNPENWRLLLRDAVNKTDWSKVKKDVENFLENESDIKVFTKENVLGIIG
ncbi:MAG: hypothetical protein A2252_07525 [Elusimicrobia bacterium RIFOXYA2_FULL_39_19]|nr:MAG: hypothetical protein A2252_07525 [Elusimicrobia bacterium RIFOXYA2_FULL_39_19]